jgi:hypothetical protein
MAQITIPCLVGKKNKAGIVSWYWQPSKTLAAAGWKAMTLGKDEGNAIVQARKRNEEVDAWRTGGGRPIEVKRHVDKGTVDALIARYRREVIEGINPATGRRQLKPKTIEAYETALKRISVWAGKHPIAYVTPARIRALRDLTAKPVIKDKDGKVTGGGIGHSAAFNLLKTVRQLFAFAESVDLIAKGSNPATSFGLGAPPPRRQLWELKDDAAFDAAAIALGMPSMALARELALYSAQREGDLITFSEAEYRDIDIDNVLVRERFAAKDGSVKGWDLAQGKTSDEYVSVELKIPFEPQLRAKVERAIATNRARDRAADPQRLITYVLVDDRTGMPWKKRAFIDAWTEILAHAAKSTGRTHMTDLVWHDLRRTRVVRLRRRGMDPAMIASITGHSPASINMMLKVYGPVDATITAAALASGMDPLPVPPAAESEEKSA